MYTETQHLRVEGDEEAGSKSATTGHVISGQGKCFHSDRVCQDLHASTKRPGPLWGRLASCACPPSGCPGPPQRMCSWHSARVSSAYFWVCVWKELCAGMGVRAQTLRLGCVSLRNSSAVLTVDASSLLPSPSQSDAGCSYIPFVFSMEIHIYGVGVLSSFIPKHLFSLPQTLCFRLLDWAYDVFFLCL